jgi:hypothetical protein
MLNPPKSVRGQCPKPVPSGAEVVEEMEAFDMAEDARSNFVNGEDRGSVKMLKNYYNRQRMDWADERLSEYRVA